MTDLPVWIRAGGWVVALIALSPAIFRICTGRSLRLDPIWGIAFLLVLNRLSWVFHLSAGFSHVTGFILALSLAGMSVSYQRADREAKGGGSIGA